MNIFSLIFVDILESWNMLVQRWYKQRPHFYRLPTWAQCSYPCYLGMTFFVCVCVFVCVWGGGRWSGVDHH